MRSKWKLPISTWSARERAETMSFTPSAFICGGRRGPTGTAELQCMTIEGHDEMLATVQRSDRQGKFQKKFLEFLAPQNSWERLPMLRPLRAETPQTIHSSTRTHSLLSMSRSFIISLALLLALCAFMQLATASVSSTVCSR